MVQAPTSEQGPRSKLSVFLFFSLFRYAGSDADSYCRDTVYHVIKYWVANGSTNLTSVGRWQSYCKVGSAENAQKTKATAAKPMTLLCLSLVEWEESVEGAGASQIRAPASA